jgi:DNA-binding response OmpR family regulator/HPt (histidine-containing phosphotransfer) domain-containing protein
VDDNPVSLKITAGLIHAAGFETAAAESGEQALERMAERLPNLVVTGLRLPGMDGLALTRKLKAHAEWKSIPVILLTAAYWPEEEAEAVKAGCECSIAKPVDVNLFPGMIALYMGAPAAVPPQAEPRRTDNLPMQELREEFLTGSAAECRNILAGFGEAPDYPAIRKALHRWAGVGGTLGFPEITTTARDLESMAANPQPDQTEDLGLGLSELLELFTTATPVELPPLSEEPGAPAAPVSSKAPVILVADDDPLVRAAIKRTIESNGYRCRLADDGATTFAMARTEPPDAIVLDINMPKMDGFQVLYALRNVWATRFVPVLMLTASHDQADVMRGGLLGASDYMTKPFDLEALVKRIDRLLVSR